MSMMPPVSHVLSRVAVGHDRRAFWTERRIAIGMIKVPMGVHDVVDALSA